MYLVSGVQCCLSVLNYCQDVDLRSMTAGEKSKKMAIGLCARQRATGRRVREGSLILASLAVVPHATKYLPTIITVFWSKEAGVWQEIHLALYQPRAF